MCFPFTAMAYPSLPRSAAASGRPAASRSAVRPMLIAFPVGAPAPSRSTGKSAPAISFSHWARSAAAFSSCVVGLAGKSRT